MLQNYAVIGLMFLSAALMGSMLLGLGMLVRRHNPTPAKLQPYESGVPDVDPPRGRYNPRFYVVAILFVVFDIEAIFLFPWAVAFGVLGLYGYIEAIVFISILVLGLLYEWKKGALEWV
ncbi:MAG TPA: NADH-quinone oxidoreductase subunit A [Nitrolancea sp.]|jgi:NADH-quinone oxidoreductase subunit A|nr:NADH-quinone oxidoreductase subunit A [Nitrolancea sp.]